MKISIIGATGMAGSAIVTEALDRGHTVVAASRNPRGLPAHERLLERRLDVSHFEDVASLLAETDVAVLAIRSRNGTGHLASGTARFLDAAATVDVPVLIVGGAAPLRSPNDPDRLVVDDPAYVPAAWRATANESLAQFRACAAHPYRGWTYLSPPAIFETGPRSGEYRRGTTQLLTDPDGTSRITAADLAIAVIDEIEAPHGERHFTVVQNP